MHSGVDMEMNLVCDDSNRMLSKRAICSIENIADASSCDLIDGPSVTKDESVEHESDHEHNAVTLPASDGSINSSTEITMKRTKSKDHELDKEAAHQPQQSKASSTDSFQDVEFDFLLLPKTIKRSTSLKQCRPCDKDGESTGALTSPGRRKTVRFADALGLDLASVRHIMNPDEPPTVPSSVRKTLERDSGESRPEEVAFWRIRFVQPLAASPDFLRKVLDRKVMLESCSVNNHDLKVHGVVRVANVAFEKSVAVRYSENGWLTYKDVQARYVKGSNDLATDRFYFYFDVPGHLGVRNRIEFAVIYVSAGQTFWDSNNGYNYTLECIHHLGYE